METGRMIMRWIRRKIDEFIFGGPDEDSCNY